MTSHRRLANGKNHVSKNGGYSNGVSANGIGTICGHEKKNGHYQPLKYERPVSKESYEQAPLVTAVITYFGFYLLMLLGFVNQFLFPPVVATERNRDGYPGLYDRFERFYLRYVYRRIRDCWNRPICSVPGAEVTLKDRITKDYGWTFEFTGTETRCLNLGSYNYLGFAQNQGPCATDAEVSIRTHGLALCSPRRELGTNDLHLELEALTARYLQVEDAIVFGMGFATNSLNLPSLLSPGCLVVSDEKNHASIILGLRLSGATVRVFTHNNMTSLEKVLKDAVVKGQPAGKGVAAGRPWKKILIIIEGVFSMEGSIVKLPEIIALKKKYKAYVYLDEAHSIGATGPSGRGVIDYYGIDPKEIDILMGTFTKSFGSSGGYIAGSRKLINFLRANSHAHCYASSMSPPITQQILTSMKIIMGLDGTNEGQKRIDQLSRNTRYFRRRLAQIGVITYGHEDSPVVPMLVYLFSKISAVVRTLTTRNIAVVGVGFPATPLMEGRIRFCLSAAHTKEQLDYAIIVIDEISMRKYYTQGKPTRLIALDSTTSAALTMAELMRTFTGSTETEEEFVEHCRSKMAIERCDEAQLLTVEQAETELWHQLRIGRITASRIHQASRCKMSRGSLYESIMGFSRGGFSFAMDRGTALEDSVFDVVRSEYPGLQKSGLLLNSQYPFFGASPDGIHDEFVLEIKCPLNRNTHFDYVTPGKLKKQYVGQIHMQMMMAGKRKALLAVADPSFERNKKITKVWINYDEVYTTKLMEDASDFWVQAIFTALKRHQPKKAE